MLRLKSPLSAQLELTGACNNSCIHCYNYWRYLETGQKLDKDSGQYNLDHFSQIIQMLSEIEIHALIFTGGEPFLRQDILFDLAQQGKEAGMIVGLNTNAVFIDQYSANVLNEIGIDFVLVSLLGDESSIHNAIAQTNSHERTIKGIKALTETDIELGVNMVVSRLNYKRIRQTALLLKNLGVKKFTATPVIACYLSEKHNSIRLAPKEIKNVLNDLLWIQENLDLKIDALEPLVHCMFNEEERYHFKQFLGHRTCSAGITECAISPSGDIRPCIHADYIAGNILEDGWEALRISCPSIEKGTFGTTKKRRGC